MTQSFNVLKKQFESYLTPLSVISEHPPKFRSFKDVLYLASAQRHLSETCLFPSRFNIFRHLNFFMNMRMQLSEIHKQCDKSTSSSLLWCSARASIAPVVSQEHLASFNVRKLLQYRITGCKHLALKFLHWLKFKFTKPGFWSSIGMRSASVTDEHRLRFSTFSLVQVSVNT